MTAVAPSIRTAGQRVRAGRYYNSAFGTWLSSSTLAVVGGNLYATPLELAEASSFDRIAVEVTAAAGAGGVVRLGVYADLASHYPGALISDFGTVVATATAVAERAVALSVQPGFLWLCCVEQVTSAVALSAIGSDPNMYLAPMGKTSPAVGPGAVGYVAAGITGALPGTFPPGATPTSTTPLVHVRAA